MKKNVNLLPLFVVLGFGACQKNVQDPVVKNTLSSISAAKLSQSNTTISLQVDVLTTTDTNGVAATTRIRSDVDGKAYLNGTDRVDAQILSSDGNFYMNTNNNTVRIPIRTMRFLLDPTPSLQIDGKRNYSLRTAPPSDPAITALNGGTTYWLQNMPVTVPAYSQLMSFRVWGDPQQGVADWRLLFRNGSENNSSSTTDYVKVTRADSKTWYIEGAGYSSPSSNALLTNNNGDPQGYFSVPFKLKLTRL